MAIYNEIEMLTLGYVPTVKVEVPTPTPFFPEWVLWCLGFAVLGLGILGFLYWENQKKAKEQAQQNEKLNKINAQQDQELQRFKTNLKKS